jgi:hypothetical protein
LNTSPKRAKKRPSQTVTKEKVVGTKASAPIHILADSDSSEDELRPTYKHDPPTTKLRRVTDEHNQVRRNLSIESDESISSQDHEFDYDL